MRTHQQLLDEGGKSGNQRIRKPEAVFSCEFCPMTFSRIRHFNAHRATHTGEQTTLPCTICQQQFIDINELKQHKRKEHPGTVLDNFNVFRFWPSTYGLMLFTNRFISARYVTNLSLRRQLCSDIKLHTHKTHIQNLTFRANIVIRSLLQQRQERCTKERIQESVPLNVQLVQKVSPLR